MRILVFGDSIIQGFHDEEMGGWVKRLGAYVMKREVESGYAYNKSILNLGISGDTSEDVLRRAVPETLARVGKYPTQDYDVALLAIGINDSQFEMSTMVNKVSIEQFKKNINEIIAALLNQVKKVVIVGITSVIEEKLQPMPWKITHGYSNEQISLYNGVLQQVSEDNGLLYIDCHAVYLNNEKCLPDGLHPNAAGHQLIFERVKSALEAENIL